MCPSGEFGALVVTGQPVPQLFTDVFGVDNLRQKRKHVVRLGAALAKEERLTRRQLDLTRTHRPTLGVSIL